MLHNKKNELRAQISAETLVTVGIVFLLLVVILAYNTMENDTTSLVGTSIQDKSDCLKLSQILSKVYSSGNGTVATFFVKSSAQISSPLRTITVREESCTFLANAQDKNLLAQEYTLTNLDGNVIFS